MAPDGEPGAPAPVTRPPALPEATRTLVGLAAAVVVLVGLSLAREIVGPLALGAVIVIICHPLRHPLERHGWPRWAATTAVIAVAYVVLAIMALLLTYAGFEFVRLVRGSADALTDTAGSVIEWLEGWGVEREVSGAARSVLDPTSLLGYLGSAGAAGLGILTAFFFVLAYVVFMAADGSRYARAEQTLGPAVAPMVGRFRAFGTGVRRYYIVNAGFGAVVAIIDGLALWALQIPAPIVWAILAFVTNFIPNIGFVVGLVPPALLALVVGGWPLMLVVIAIYCVVNVTLQVMIQPKFVSDAVDLSLTLSFFSVVFWTFVIGPLGAILSVPLTLLVRALLLDGDAGAWWLRWLSGSADARA